MSNYYNTHNYAPTRAAETRALGSRYLGPVPRADLGPIPASMGKVQQSLFGGQDLGKASYFGPQDIGYFAPAPKGLGMLSDNEKRLVAVGVIGIVGWLMFGDKIKKGFKKNPASKSYWGKGSKPRAKLPSRFKRELENTTTAHLHKLQGIYLGHSRRKGSSADARGRARAKHAAVLRELRKRKAE